MRHTWTSRETGFLRDHYGKTPARVIAGALGLSIDQVRSKAFIEHLSKRQKISPEIDALIIAASGNGVFHERDNEDIDLD